MREVVHPISPDRAGLPEGWTASHHELRGYDSPDRWLSAKHVSGKQVTASTLDELRKAVAQVQPMMRTPIHTIYVDVDEVLANWLAPTLALLGHTIEGVTEAWAQHHPRPWDLFPGLGNEHHALRHDLARLSDLTTPC